MGLPGCSPEAHRGMPGQLHADFLMHTGVGQRRVEAVAQGVERQPVELLFALALNILRIDHGTLDDAGFDLLTVFVGVACRPEF